MTDQTQAQATRVVPAGWYEDPASADLVRWWNGLTWTDHTEAKPSAQGSAAAGGAHEGGPLSDSPAPRVPLALESSRRPIISGTPGVWFLAITPALLFVVGAIAAYLFLYVSAVPAAIAAIAGFYVLGVFAAFLDSRLLRNRGFRAAAPLWSLIGALPYLLVRRRVIATNGPLIAFFAIVVIVGGAAAGIFASGVGAPVTQAFLVQSTLQERLVDAGSLESVTCPAVLDDVTVGASVHCDAVQPDGTQAEVVASLGPDNTVTYSFNVR